MHQSLWNLFLTEVALHIKERERKRNGRGMMPHIISFADISQDHKLKKVPTVNNKQFPTQASCR